VLRGGAFAPGATPEANGYSEIEIAFGGGGFNGNILGTNRADELHWGGDKAGLNLNPRDGQDEDVDVTVTGAAFLSVEGRKGNDRIITAQGTAISGDVYSEGGPGDDLLTSAPRPLRLVRTAVSIMEGGLGNDTLRGGRGEDDLSGGKGADRAYGAEGPICSVATRGATCSQAVPAGTTSTPVT
jgi:Ca2+-binding RTX toxin-like protein